ncbi:MAG TPA: PIN domain-containing protein, partial [Anaerolineae bacterium]
AFINEVNHATGSQIVADFAGFGVGLLLGALLAFPLALLPDPFRQILPILAAVFLAYMGALIMNTHYREIFAVFNIQTTDSKSATRPNGQPVAKQRLLLDTSVIIDGRIADIYDTGFIRAEMVIPRFVLNELQRVADATDSLRRMRGRRGLEVLKRLQGVETAIRITDDDPEAAGGVDDKLVILAKQWSCPIVTNDYNLNKVASLQGVTVLNINELANAVKTVLIPGETLSIHVIQEGKESGQGVGYLEDGTMVVIEDGLTYLDRNINVTVTKVLQTAAGKMIFAKP